MMDNAFDDWAQDLRLLAWLNIEEREPALLLEMAARGFPEGLVIGCCAQTAAMRGALAALTRERSDDLAADFAAIYLTHAYRVSPCESVWRDEDHLAWQGPTFAVRAWYQRYGLSVKDWRALPDDHLAHQLEFAAFLLERGETEAAARFLDAHLLTFLPQFCELVAQRAATAFYRGLADITQATVAALRCRLPRVAPQSETEPEEVPAVPVHFVGRDAWLGSS